MKPSQKESVALIVVSLLQTVFIVFVARGLIQLISLCTNIFYYGRFSFEEVSPDPYHFGLSSLAFPVIGGLIVGLMARFGSQGIRGHGIPEAMESILIRESRIPKRMTLLKPLSSAVAIGSGGPFGAEGPIIATGGAFGSLLGQVFPFRENSRKILLASGAAAGMTAIFGTPLSAILLSIELLLFEFKAGSFIPIALCAALANCLRATLFGWDETFFKMRVFAPPTEKSFIIFLLFGVLLGVLSVFIIKSVYWVEDLFEKIKIHWMWWPAIGGLAVGIFGFIEPRSLGVGYNNITDALQNNMSLQLAASLLIFKFLSWAFALGSGTSGGTLAPLMTLGATVGLLVQAALSSLTPALAPDPQVMALAGMAGLFAACSRAVLASVLFAFEGTRESLGIVPLLGTCSMAYLLSRTMCVDSIMTLKIVRRGVHVPHEYIPAPLETPRVSEKS